MKTTYARSVIGAVLMIAAVTFLGICSGWWQFTTDFDGMWTLIFTVPAIVWMLFFGVNIVNSLLFFTGFGILLIQSGIVPQTANIPLVISMAVMAVGVTVLGSIGTLPLEESVLRLKKKRKDNSQVKVCSFCKGKYFLNGVGNVTDANLSATFCECAYDFSECRVDQDLIFNVKSFGAAIVIYAPKDCKVVLNSTGFASKAENRLVSQQGEHTIYFQGRMTFGKLIIK